MQKVFEFAGGGVAMGMTILTTRSEASPNPAFNFAQQRGWPLYLSTKDTILKAYDGRFREVYESEFAEEFKKRNLTCEHRLIDDMVALALKWNGGFVWGARIMMAMYSPIPCAELWLAPHDDLGSADARRQDGGDPKLRTAPSPATIASTSRVETSTNPIASIFAWTRGLRYRGTFDNTPDVVRFAENLEKRRIWRRSVSIPSKAVT